MLDGVARRWIDPGLSRLGAPLARAGVPADAVTLAGFALGLAAAGLILAELFIPALFVILLSRLCDGLDGVVARHRGATDRGGYLDIVLDFAFYAVIPLSFVLARPATNALPGAVLLASFYINGASFLAFAAMAERRGLDTEARGPKSLYFTTGFAEATETIAAFCLFCLLPNAFAEIAYLFAALCLVTAASRIALAMQTFR